jgi:CubicO group peptidase (beta-lactamase class C family)
MGATAAPLSLFSGRIYPAEMRPSEKERVAMRKIAEAFREQFHVPGLSVAFARHGQMVYQEAFGHADIESNVPATSAHLFRIASVTKPITSAAIFALLEEGKLGLNDRVFGPEGWLRSDDPPDLTEHAKQITIHHLLTHTSGAWPSDCTDPMFRDPSISQRDVILWTLTNRAVTEPAGTSYAYSNFGYCLLGRIIERATRMDYADYVRNRILWRSHISSMRIADSRRAGRARNEVVYYAEGPAGSCAPLPYNMNVARMDSHGGWIATAADLVRFANAVSGFKSTESILSSESLRVMNRPVPASTASGYACGWSVNTVPNWWHIGSLPGTTSIVVRTASGMCWAALANRRANGINLGIDNLMWEMARAVPSWKA